MTRLLSNVTIVWCTVQLLLGCSPSLDLDALTADFPQTFGAPSGAILGIGEQCLDGAGCGGVSGQVQLCPCSEKSESQRWTLANDGTFRVMGQCLEVATSNVPGDTGFALTLASCRAESSAQLWVVLRDSPHEGHDAKIVSVEKGTCLDVTESNTRPGTSAQLFDCRDDVTIPAQAWTVPGPALPARQWNQAAQDVFGPNVYVIDESQDKILLQRQLKAISAAQERSLYGLRRFALLFMPGTYDLDLNLGYFMQIAGLGATPSAVTIRGSVSIKNEFLERGFGGANFYRGAENLTVQPVRPPMNWGAARGTSLRRVRVRGNLLIGEEGVLTSGGFMADSQIDGTVIAGSQQQWLARSSRWQAWTGGQWNMVFAGDLGEVEVDEVAKVSIPDVPRMREKPFLYFDQGEYFVFVPRLKMQSRGPSWSDDDEGLGDPVPLSDFKVVRQGDSAESIAQALEEGRNLLFTPGIYPVDRALTVSRSDTIVLGLGYATLATASDATFPALTVAAEASGVTISGLMFEANGDSTQLMKIGDRDSQLSYPENPTFLHDLSFRIGRRGDVSADVSLEIDSPNVVGDNLFFLRSDNRNKQVTGEVGWLKNRARTGLSVNADDVTMYGLYVEHYQEHQVRWAGNGGETYLYSSETPNDVPGQSEWMDGARNGYATYRIEPSVTKHTALGLSVRCCHSTTLASVTLDRAFEAPMSEAGISLQHVATLSLGEGTGSIRHVINDEGDAVDASSRGSAYLEAWPASVDP